MKRLAYTPLHYGAEYLDAAIRSVAPCVDQFLILYTDTPSYGHSENISCPETQDELRDIAYRAAGDKIHWIDISGQVRQENEHRACAKEYALLHGFDQMVAVDADEVWDTEILRATMKEAESLPYDRIAIRKWVHFWRSFNWCNRDQFLPVRIYNLKVPFNKEEIALDGMIYHFGYAQNPDMVRYKKTCHGHRSEFRPEWLEEIFMQWVPGMNKVHPVSLEIWDPEPFDKTTLPDLLKKHPNYDKWII